MQDDLVDVFEAENVMEAQLLTTRLEEAGIKSFIDNDDSPLDGLTAGDQMVIVRVLPKDVPQARKVAEEFLSEKMEDVDFDELIGDEGEEK